MIKTVRGHEALQSEYYQEVLKSLERWNGSYNEEMYEPTIFSLWDYYTMLNNTNQEIVEKVANSLVQSIATLENMISRFKENWKWKLLHSRAYPHFPFSRTSLNRFFSLHQTYGGSKNTIDTCLYYLSDFPKNKFD